MNKQQIVSQILSTKIKNFDAIIPNSNGGFAFAPANIALCKYWGKRDTELNIPYTPSLSISLGDKGAFTCIKEQQDCNQDTFILNNSIVDPKSSFAKRLTLFLDLFRRTPETFYLVDSTTNIPVAAGLASSACGFAALNQALNNLYNWQLDKRSLSILARLGSGSACRSLWDGFVTWDAGTSSDGMDSFAEKLDITWPELRIGIITISTQAKSISSRDAMQQTVQSSPFYNAWSEKAAIDFAAINNAIINKNFEQLGKISEQNALCMHATMMSATPAIIYSQPETLTVMRQIWDLRHAGFPIFFTQDAGPNLKLLFLDKHQPLLKKVFPEIEIISPFAAIKPESLILVDNHDKQIGIGEKLATHKYARLHRAFSVFIMRRHGNSTEILLQQRSAAKYHSPNLWTNTCCGHPRPGETTIAAASRRLYEEMGIHTELKEIGKFHYCVSLNNELSENEIDHVFIGNLDAETINCNPDEAQAYKWMSLVDLKRSLETNPERYTAWLKPALELLLAKL